MDFSSEDLSQIKERGMTPETIEEQIGVFKRGNIVANLREAANVKNGIDFYSDEKKEELIALYESQKDKLDILKFVPASGAATRMFKSLYEFLEKYEPKNELVEDYVERKNDPKLELFFRRMPDLPFFGDIKKNIEDFDALRESERQFKFVKAMLGEGYELGDAPKGLVPFHLYKTYAATAFEEHLREAADYAVSNGKSKIHFTVTKAHLHKFEEEYKRIRQRLEEETGIKFEISFSFQDQKTDTLAVDENNEPIRDENGKLFFRPGGHGALLDNLNQQQADLIFIKNIDNVVVPKHRDILAENKKMLAGRLLQLQKKTFEYLKILEEEDVSEEKLNTMLAFMQKQLNSGLSFEEEGTGKDEKIAFIKRKLNRPIRVCGMVKNEGEPGGGPFWTTDKSGEISLQIVESAQIDFDNYQQSKIAQEASHFNPVDLVCGTKNHKGETFNLHDFVDRDAGFISNKTQNGKPLKALEHPGLWNGGMANWITIFVEVPIETFNPVKTVADLLKPTHQVNRFG
ncbi:MAG TPA: DUF4301 family protein [Salinimicrobium sp.]|nr:DUF4301 family protein [Salinimicrobium sp.]